MYKYFINKLKKKIEILFLVLLVLITAISSNYFYSEKNKIDALSFLGSFKPSTIKIGLNIEGSNEKKKISAEDIARIILGLHNINNNIIIILFHKPNDRNLINQLIPNEKSYLSFLFEQQRSRRSMGAQKQNQGRADFALQIPYFRTRTDTKYLLE